MGIPIRLITHFSIIMIKTRGQWQNIFKVLRVNNYSHKHLQPAKQLFKKDKIKFLEKIKHNLLLAQSHWKLNIERMNAVQEEIMSKEKNYCMGNSK